MNWSDERYVKLYTRQTATWRLWPWQSRALLPLLLQVADGAGLIDVGAKDPLAALAVLVMVPREVVEVGVEGLLADGTLERLPGRGYLIPKYIEAQEATKTERAKKADQRAGQRDKARGIAGGYVPTCPPQSLDVPPSPAQPIPAQPSPAQGAGAEPPGASKKAKKAKVDKPPDPRHAPLREAMTTIFELVRGSTYPFSPRDAAALRDLLAAADVPTITEAWTRALRHRGYPTVSTFVELHANLSHFVGAGPPAAKEPFDPNQGIMRSKGVVYADNVNIGLTPEPAGDTYDFTTREDPFPWKK